jgi:LacI family transcriptional regulator
MARKHRTPQVALLIETSRAFGRELIEGIVQYVREHGPWSIQFEERGLEDPPPKWLRGWRGDGIIARTATPALARAIRNTGRPTVEMLRNDRMPGDLECDHDAVGEMAVEHFIGRGLREFGFFAFGDAAWIRVRREGFVRALAARGYGCFQYRPRDRRRVILPHWNERQHIPVVRWLRSLPQPTGIFCAGDVHAMRLLEVCRACQIAVPERIAVLGVDNDKVICNVTNPPLSSVDIDGRRIGYEAAALLSRRMAGRLLNCNLHLVPPSHIAMRQSTDVLAISDSDVAEAIRFIRENAHRGIRVSDVTAEIGLSRRTLERRFRHCLHRSLKTEILRVQIENAKMLLAQSGLSVEAIGKQCGFPNFKYFGQVFRRETGVTPRAFRQQSPILPRRLTSQ